MMGGARERIHSFFFLNKKEEQGTQRQKLVQFDQCVYTKVEILAGSYQMIFEAWDSSMDYS